MNWPRAILHLDMDTFFVSVERKFDPSLNGKPVIVGGGPDGDRRRGVVAACSYETRVFGVRSAMPLAQALRLCPEAIVVPVGRSNYSAETRRIRETLETLTELYEMTSPDEAFIDLRGTEALYGSPKGAADTLWARLDEHVGLPFSIGLATSKTVAKIASKLAKPRGLFVVPPGEEPAVLAPLPIRALPGLGPKTAEALARREIHTLGELADLGPRRLADMLGEGAASLARRARGECEAPVVPSRERKQISAETTFKTDIADPIQLGVELARLVMRVGLDLRGSGRWAGVLGMKLRTPNFETHTRQTPLRPPANDDPALLAASRELLRAAWDGRAPVRLLGVSLSQFTTEVQADLFGAEETDKRERLMRAVDAIRLGEGRGKLIWGSAMRGKKQE